MDMMTYRDMTFCTARECSKFSDCPRALTDKVEAQAEKWWGGPGAPVARFANPKELICYDPRPEEQE